MKMKMYYSVGTTPLMFHKFYHLVMTPLNFVMAVFLIYQAFVGQTELNWLGMGYNVLLLVALNSDPMHGGRLSEPLCWKLSMTLIL